MGAATARIVFLGTGNAFASGGRNPMAILVETRGGSLLLDCGPTTLVALKKHGLEPGAIDLILLSHHHGDHFAGVPSSFSTRCTSRGGKTIVFSGDTGWTDALIEPARCADLFICECSSFERPIDKHMSYTELVREQSRLEAKRTLLVHPGDDVLAKAQELEHELAYDGMEVML